MLWVPPGSPCASQAQGWQWPGMACVQHSLAQTEETSVCDGGSCWTTAGRPGQVWGTALCPGLCVCVSARECRGLNPVGLSSSSLVRQSPRLRAPNRAPLARRRGRRVGAEEPLGVRVQLELGGGPVTQPQGKWGPRSRCPVNTRTHNSHTRTRRSILRHTEHNTHPCYTLTNRIQTHIPQTLTAPSPHIQSIPTHSHTEGEHTGELSWRVPPHTWQHHPCVCPSVQPLR